MPTVSIAATSLICLIEDLFVAHGASGAAAWRLADSLVSADLEGVASHGVTLLPMYLDRVRAGSVSMTAVPAIVEDFGGLVVMDAANALGQISAQAAIELVIERAAWHGVAVVTVRQAFHFGAAAYWARQCANAGMIGMVFSNTRPLMPAPGGAERVVGNNPLAIAFPSADGSPLVVDMAMSATAMGKIRIAEAQSREIPAGWATDAHGRPTRSPAAAIAGMLLPAAGPKGFGLAVAVDLLCGALSGGAVGAVVQPLYGDASVPYNCAHTFIAIDASRTRKGAGIGAQVRSFADTIRGSRRARGVERLFAPGDIERGHRAESGGLCTLATKLVDLINDEAQHAGITARLSPDHH